MCAVAGCSFRMFDETCSMAINSEGLVLLIYEMIVDALMDYRNGGSWFVDHFDETPYADAVPVTTKVLRGLAEDIPKSMNSKAQVKRWLFDRKVKQLIDLESTMTPSRLSTVFGISHPQACMVLRRMCTDGVLVKSKRGTYSVQVVD